MDTMNFKKIIKNKYFAPIFLGVIIAIGGILIGFLQNNEKSFNPEEKTNSVMIKEKKDLKNLLFGEKKYDLSYADKETNLVENISFFESGENWQGNGFLDWRNFYEGKSSLGLSSNNHQTGIVFLEKKIDLSSFDFVEFLMSINDINAFESIIIKIGDLSLTNYYSYNLSNVNINWQFIRISKDQFIVNKVDSEFDWKNIEKIQFEVVSRPNTTEIVNFDYLTAQKNIDYLNKWKTINENFLSLAKIDDKIILLARNDGALQAILNEVSGDNFTYQASFIPQIKSSSLGLFFRGNYGNSKGYYFLADGINKNSFTLKKLGKEGWTILKTVEISNFTLEKNEKCWLKVETKGEKIIAFVSNDGKNFTEIININDDEFYSGGVGIAIFSKAYAFFDDFKFEQ